MSDPRDQPMDTRLSAGMGLRDFIIMEVGSLKENQARSSEERREIVDTLKKLLEETRGVAVALERAAGDGKMQDKVISDLVEIVDGSQRKPGLIQRVDDLEKAQARARNTALGIALGSGIGGTGMGAGLYAVGKKLGLWIIVVAVIVVVECQT